ncbi:metallophosphoesterase [Micrococcoides hystricis]|uniref:Metallophosphoesterase n=1 Tax=Micrococcoides hystricis TaxID=1572761 RepID=A0ABV6PF61_9MICC
MKSAPSSLTTTVKTAGAGLLAGVAAAGASLLVRATYEHGRALAERGFTVRHETFPVLSPGAEPIKVLHLGDIHLTPGQHHKLAWLKALAALEPDVVINTGDNLGHPEVNAELLDVLEPLLAVPGVFVPGSNDYYAPIKKNPLRYFLTPAAKVGAKDDHPVLPWQELFAGFSRNWLDLTNRTGRLQINGTELLFSGVDDPHLRREAFPGFPITGRESAKTGRAPVRIGVLHAPYQRVLNQMTAQRADVLFAGHTHGGQICLPGSRALVSNCDLPPSLASGATHWNATDATGQQRSAWLNITAGIGSAPTVPLRFFCPPEAVLVTLTAGAEPSAP